MMNFLLKKNNDVNQIPINNTIHDENLINFDNKKDLENIIELPYSEIEIIEQFTNYIMENLKKIDINDIFNQKFSMKMVRNHYISEWGVRSILLKE
jgi:hypothetical protein